MTRKEELEQRAIYIADWSHKSLITTDEILEELVRVEREVWARCASKIESLMEKENESTDDQVWEFRDWCKQQQEGL